MSKLVTLVALVLIGASAIYLTFDVWIWTSAALLFGSALSPLLLKRIRRRGRGLYGDSKWAGHRHMARRGIVTSRKPL